LDNIYYYRERGAKPRIAALLGSQEMVTAIMASTLTTLCVFIPILLFRNDLGMMGQLFTTCVHHLLFSRRLPRGCHDYCSRPCGTDNAPGYENAETLENAVRQKVDEILEKFFLAQERA
jgi:HAE1 family hydrophobic/amphiphilic exporter-1